MITDMYTGKWNQFRSDSQRQWNRLTDEDLDQVKDDMGKLVSLVQQRYDYTTEQANQEVTRFMDRHNSRAMQMARRLPGNVDHQVRRHPWAAIATAMSFGVAVGMLVKPDHVN
jgi:ElaB/YqjD/DUF883 family membrane-anchored ribosome-binding protein